MGGSGDGDQWRGWVRGVPGPRTGLGHHPSARRGSCGRVGGSAAVVGAGGPRPPIAAGVARRPIVARPAGAGSGGG